MCKTIHTGVHKCASQYAWTHHIASVKVNILRGVPFSKSVYLGGIPHSKCASQYTQECTTYQVCKWIYNWAHYLASVQVNIIRGTPLSKCASQYTEEECHFWSCLSCVQHNALRDTTCIMCARQYIQGHTTYQVFIKALCLYCEITCLEKIYWCSLTWEAKRCIMHIDGRINGSINKRNLLIGWCVIVC